MDEAAGAQSNVVLAAKTAAAAATAGVDREEASAAAPPSPLVVVVVAAAANTTEAQQQKEEVLQEAEGAAVPKAVLPLIPSPLLAEDAAAQQKKEEAQEEGAAVPEAVLPLIPPLLAEDDAEAQHKKEEAQEEDAAAKAVPQQLLPLADPEDPPASFPARMFLSSSSASGNSVDRSMQKVESANLSNPTEAVLEFLNSSSTTSPPPTRKLGVDSKVTATIEYVSDSGPAFKLIHGYLVTDSFGSNKEVYVVWVEQQQQTTNGQPMPPQLHVEAFSGLEQFYALVKTGAVSMAGFKNSVKPQQSSAAHAAGGGSTSGGAAAAPSISSAASPAAIIDLTGSLVTPTTSLNASSTITAAVGKPVSTAAAASIVIIDIAADDDDNEAALRALPKPKPEPSQEIKKASLSFFLFEGVWEEAELAAASDEKETLRLLSEGQISLTQLQALFVKKKRGGDSGLGASMQGGGDVALTDASVVAVIFPFVRSFILLEMLGGSFGTGTSDNTTPSSSLDISSLSSNCCSTESSSSSSRVVVDLPSQPSSSADITLINWAGAGQTEEVRQLMLHLNAAHLTGFVSISMTDIDSAPVEAFNKRIVQLPNVTYKFCDALYFVAPGRMAHICFSAMMVGPWDYVRLLLNSLQHQCRFIVSFDMNIQYLKPVMNAFVCEVLGPVQTTGGTSFQLCKLEIFHFNRKVGNNIRIYYAAGWLVITSPPFFFRTNNRLTM